MCELVFIVFFSFSFVLLFYLFFSGRALLFKRVVNLTYTHIQDRVMLTGRHMVRDVMCKNCKTKLGWMYEYATEESQKYVEMPLITYFLSWQSLIICCLFLFVCSFFQIQRGSCDFGAGINCRIRRFSRSIFSTTIIKSSVQQSKSVPRMSADGFSISIIMPSFINIYIPISFFSSLVIFGSRIKLFI